MVLPGGSHHQWMMRNRRRYAILQPDKLVTLQREGGLPYRQELVIAVANSATRVVCICVYLLVSLCLDQSLMRRFHPRHRRLNARCRVDPPGQKTFNLVTSGKEKTLWAVISNNAKPVQLVRSDVGACAHCLMRSRPAVC